MSWHGLSDAEYDLMQLFWQDGAEDTYTLNEVIAFMETKGHVWKQQTAHTVLTKLIVKGVLQSKKNHRCRQQCERGNRCKYGGGAFEVSARK